MRLSEIEESVVKHQFLRVFAHYNHNSADFGETPYVKVVQLRKAMYEFMFIVPWLQIRLANVKKTRATFKGSFLWIK